MEWTFLREQPMTWAYTNSLPTEIHMLVHKSKLDAARASNICNFERVAFSDVDRLTIILQVVVALQSFLDFANHESADHL